MTLPCCYVTRCCCYNRPLGAGCSTVGADDSSAAITSATMGQQQGRGGSHGTHAVLPDARNADVLVGIRDGVSGSFDLVWRPQVIAAVTESYTHAHDLWTLGMRLVSCHIQCGLNVCYMPSTSSSHGILFCPLFISPSPCRTSLPALYIARVAV